MVVTANTRLRNFLRPLRRWLLCWAHDVIDFVNREMSNVVLSLDGRKEVHDRYRVDYAGNGSWEKIVPKFQKLLAARRVQLTPKPAAGVVCGFFCGISAGLFAIGGPPMALCSPEPGRLRTGLACPRRR